MNLIAGKWAGTITPGSPGLDDRFYLTIQPGGRITASWGTNTAWGTATLQNGRVAYEMESPVREGSITLYQDGGRRLVLDDLWATYSAEVTQEYGTGPPAGCSPA